MSDADTIVVPLAWTSDRNERLRVLLAEGWSAREIAADLGGVGRNAVLGKIRRLGLAGPTPKRNWTEQDVDTLRTDWDANEPAKDIAARLKRSRGAIYDKVEELGLRRRNLKHANPSGPVAKRLRIVPFGTGYALQETAPGLEIRDLPDEDIPADQRKTLLELTEDTCRWPIGEPSSPDFYFCGADTLPERPYCSYHCRIAYVPWSSSKSRTIIPPPRNVRV